MQHPAKLLSQLGIAPLKKFGQNFQVDVHVIANVADKIPPRAGILEIGPGLGAWTQVFLSRGHEMLLVEKDRALAQYLKKLFENDSRIAVLNANILELDLSGREFARTTAAVGNLPFYATSEILLKIIVDCPHIGHALFGIQHEVAERVAAGKGSSLAIALCAQGKIEIVGKISRHSFYPVPKVEAAILYFERVMAKPRPHLRELLKAAFWGKRKTLATALRNNPFWSKNAATENWQKRLQKIPQSLAPLLSRRADELSVSDFRQLYDVLDSGEYLT